MLLAAGVAAVFMYHHVAMQPAPGPYGEALTVTPQEFESQLRFLQAHGCRALTVSSVVADVEAGRVHRCEVALTFDDGYADAAGEAMPLLRRYGDSGTFFITTSFINAPGHLSAAQLSELTKTGMEIGAHTVTHADLTELGAVSAAREIGDSRMLLLRMTDQPVNAFAYPAGRYDAAVENAVRAAGFNFALSTEPGELDRSAVSRDRYALPRYRILRGRGLALLAHVLHPEAGRAAALSSIALRNIARARIEGNDPTVAERVAVALLSGAFPEPVLKVRVLKTAPAAVAGIMLSGTKFHGPVNRQTFAADVSDMIDRAFAADASITEVDVWAVVPVAVASGTNVSGDYAIPTNRTVFSAAVLREHWLRKQGDLGLTFWEQQWLQRPAQTVTP